jgi:CRISPR/Cas system CSM-associated protein Csm3 (group 7 of RAMP superfamily)
VPDNAKSTYRSFIMAVMKLTRSELGQIESKHYCVVRFTRIKTIERPSPASFKNNQLLSTRIINETQTLNTFLTNDFPKKS